MLLARPAPAAPSGWPVPQPTISTGARIALTTTLADWISIGGPTMPLARRPVPIAALGNITASAGRKA